MSPKNVESTGLKLNELINVADNFEQYFNKNAFIFLQTIYNCIILIKTFQVSYF